MTHELFTDSSYDPNIIMEGGLIHHSVNFLEGETDTVLM